MGYANFISKQTQTTTTGNAVPVNLETDIVHPSIRLVDNNKIYIDNDGPYNLQFSFQVVSTNASTQSIEVWIRYNGVDYPWSNTRVDVNKGASVAAWNIFGEASGDGYVQIMWRPTSWELLRKPYCSPTKSHEAGISSF